MNCKQGDLALVIRSSAANVGKFVRCVELLPPGACNTSIENGPIWRIDRELEWESALGKFPGYLAPDWALMPVRPPDSEASALVLKAPKTAQPVGG